MKQYTKIIGLVVCLSNLLSSSIAKECVEKCASMVFFSCQVCYSICEEKQKFNSCQHTYCAQYYTDYDGDRSCVRYQTDQLQEQECFITCCHSDVTSEEFTIEDFQKCKAGNDRSLGLAIGIPFGLIFLIGIICICCHCKNSTNCCGNFFDCFGQFCTCILFLITCGCCRRNSRPEEQMQQNKQKKQNSILSVQSFKPVDANELWVLNQNPNLYQMTDSICSICLDNKVNLLTRCGHVYHIQCLWDWLQRNKTCPNCINQEIDPMKFYCRGCMNVYAQINLKLCRNVNTFIGNIKGPNCPTCQ